ncbi:MAG: hypothetical protein AAGF49_08125, partial [Pseudomonadota bacterium]
PRRPRPKRTFRRVHLPLLSGGLVTAFLITFVDIMKELPATLILRPFNFDTLAIRAHRLASDERLELSSVPSLLIVAVGLLPVILLTRQITNTYKKRVMPRPTTPAAGLVAAKAAMENAAVPSVAPDVGGAPAQAALTTQQDGNKPDRPRRQAA